MHPAIHNPRAALTPSERLFAEQRRQRHARIDHAAKICGERPASPSRTRPYSPSNAFRIIVAPAKPETLEQWTARMALVPLRADREYVNRLVAGIDPIQPGKPRVADVLDAVAAHYGVAADDIRARVRTAQMAWPRHVAIWLSYHLVLKSLPKLSFRFAGRDHTSLLHSVQRVDGRLKHDEDFQQDIASIREALYAMVAAR